MFSGPGAPAKDIVIDTENAGSNRIVARAWAGMEAQKIGLQDDAQTKEQLLALLERWARLTLEKNKCKIVNGAERTYITQGYLYHGATRYKSMTEHEDYLHALLLAVLKLRQEAKP